MAQTHNISEIYYFNLTDNYPSICNAPGDVYFAKEHFCFSACSLFC